MHIHGGCYCGAVRYEAKGEPLLRLQCFCRECQYISGGSANLIVGMRQSGFSYVKGQPRQFSRTDIEAPVRRDFCESCGTHLLTISPRIRDAVLIKVGTLDDPGLFQKPSAVIFAAERQAFHQVPDDVAVYERRAAP